MMVHILDLPNEILIHIFEYCFASQNQRQFLVSIGSVCVKWFQLCQHPLFWRKFDGSLSIRTLQKLSKENVLIHTKELTYSYTKVLKSSKPLKETFSNLPNLISINFSLVNNLHCDVLTCLSENCSGIKEIKFSDASTHPNYSINEKFLANFLNHRGENLTKIDVSNANISAFTTFIKKIALSCPNLEELLAQNITESVSTFPLEIVQRNCPKIKVLRLGEPITFSQIKSDKALGFPCLEVFTHPSTEGTFTDKNLLAILHESYNLKVLDIRGCSFLTPRALLSLPATNLECLYLSLTSPLLMGRINDIFMRWGKSLHTVDISKSKCNLDKIFEEAISFGRLANLESLDLCNTNISISTVVKLIENCEKLSTLNLSSCRMVGRGRMREHRGRNEIQKLLDILIDDLTIV